MVGFKNLSLATALYSALPAGYALIDANFEVDAAIENVGSAIASTVSASRFLIRERGEPFFYWDNESLDDDLHDEALPSWSNDFSRGLSAAFHESGCDILLDPNDFTNRYLSLLPGNEHLITHNAAPRVECSPTTSEDGRRNSSRGRYWKDANLVFIADKYESNSCLVAHELAHSIARGWHIGSLEEATATFTAIQLYPDDCEHGGIPAVYKKYLQMFFAVLAGQNDGLSNDPILWNFYDFELTAEQEEMLKNKKYAEYALKHSRELVHFFNNYNAPKGIDYYVGSLGLFLLENKLIDKAEFQARIYELGLTDKVSNMKKEYNEVFVDTPKVSFEKDDFHDKYFSIIPVNIKNLFLSSTVPAVFFAIIFLLIARRKRV